MNLKKKIKQGESRTLELKRELPSSIIIAKTVIAFSNGAGGDIIIGVDDNRNIVGINEHLVFELRDSISNIISDMCSPMIIPEIFTETINKKIISIIHIYRGSFKPYYLKKVGIQQGTYVRVGATNKNADLSLIYRLERERKNISFDTEINLDYNLNKINWLFLEKKLNKNLSKIDLKNLKLIIEENGNDYLTNAALILAGKLENCYVNCARFQGDTSEVFIDNKEFTGDIFSQLDNIEIFFKNHLMRHGEIKGFIRDNSYEIPMIAIREAVINALVHRDYSILGSNIKIAIFDHQVKIISPGVLPNSITLENILEEERSEIRNPVVARIFKELNLIEQWGTGFTKMKISCKKAGVKIPVVKESANFLQIIFERTSKEPQKTDEKPTKNRRKTDEKIINTKQEKQVEEFLKEKSIITSKDVEKMFNLKNTRAKEILTNMIKKGLIVKKGETKGSYYIFKK